MQKIKQGVTLVCVLMLMVCMTACGTINTIKAGVMGAVAPVFPSSDNVVNELEECTLSTVAEDYLESVWINNKQNQAINELE